MRGKLDPQRDQHDAHGLIPAHAGKTTCSWSPRRTPRAHPRSHGENSPQKSFVSGVTGSSPLTRGKRRRIDPVPETVGLIPAHAGKTRRCSSTVTSRAAHSRSRGDNFWILPLAPGIAGSSPLTRGKRILGQGDTLSDGLIPAHAGKTLSSSPPGVKARAHPHSRGENLVPVRTGSACAG